MPAVGDHAPVHIAAGTFGPHRALQLSPQHRVLICDSRFELLFGEAEVPVTVKDLINGRSVSVHEGGMVEYVHLMSDRLQVVFAEGLATESFLPGPQTTKSFDAPLIAEIAANFPDLDPVTGHRYSSAALPDLLQSGTVVLDMAPPKSGASVLLDCRGTADVPCILSIFHDADSSISLLRRNGHTALRHHLPGPLTQGRGEARLIYQWDAPARNW